MEIGFSKGVATRTKAKKTAEGVLHPGCKTKRLIDPVPGVEQPCHTSPQQSHRSPNTDTVRRKQGCFSYCCQTGRPGAEVEGLKADDCMLVAMSFFLCVAHPVTQGREVPSHGSNSFRFEVSVGSGVNDNLSVVSASPQAGKSHPAETEVRRPPPSPLRGDTAESPPPKAGMVKEKRHDRQQNFPIFSSWSPCVCSSRWSFPRGVFCSLSIL